MITRRKMLGAAVAAGSGALATQAAAADDAPVYKFRLQAAKPRTYDGGSVREHRVADFPMAGNTSGGAMRLAVGGIREPHWHPNSDEWAYVLEGKVRLTVVDPKGRRAIEDLEAGDVWFVPVGYGHSTINIGNTEAHFLLVHNNGDFTTIELSEWVAGGPTEAFATTLNMPAKAFDDVPKKKVYITRKKS